MKRHEMKRMVMRCAALLAGVLLTAGCAQSTAPVAGASQGASQDLLAQLKERGTIIVAMEGTWAPWTYHDESGELVGYDVEVAQKVAEKLGLTAEFVEGEWD